MSESNLVSVREFESLKKTVDKLVDRIREIENVDSIQSNDIAHIKSDLGNVNSKLDKILEKVSEDRGGKAYLKWFIGILGSILALALGYNELQDK